MKKKEAFEKFAPSILKTYHQDPEAFWAAIMAPFLVNETSLADWWQRLKVDVNLLAAFQGLDADAHQTLKEFSAPLGFDLTQWKSNRSQYFKDAYPVFAFLAVWMDEEGLTDLIANFGEILRAGVYAVAGYGILDENVDANQSSPVEILTAQALIAEYETLALSIFGISPVNLNILHKMRTLFLQAEIKEKYSRGKASPYSLDRPQDLGSKGANSVAPFMLSLEKLGKSALIDDYWEVFLLFGAAIQMIDDWKDLESDLSAGHYSYVTLGVDLPIPVKDPKKWAKIIRSDTRHVRQTYGNSNEMLQRARMILARLEDPLVGRMVDITELRLNQYYQKELM